MVAQDRGGAPRATPDGRQVVAESRGVLWALPVRATRVHEARRALVRRGVRLGCRSPRLIDGAWVVPVAGRQEARLQAIAARLPSSALPFFHLPAGESAAQNAPDAHQDDSAARDAAWDAAAWGQ